MNKQRKKHKPPTLTQRFGSWRLGKRTTLFMACTFVAAMAIAVCITGSLTEPDFWQLRSVVNQTANLMMLFVVSLVFFSPFGYSWHLFLSSVDAAVAVTRGLLIVFPQTCWVCLRQMYHWVGLCSPAGQSLYSSRTLSCIRAIQAALRQRLPQQRSKSKAPILLFQQAPLLVAP